MSSQVLLHLLAFVGLTSVLALLQLLLQRRWPALKALPGFYLLLALLSLFAFLPLPELGHSWPVPVALLQESSWQWQQLQAVPVHPSLQVEPGWQATDYLLALLCLVTTWWLGALVQQQWQLKRFIVQSELLKGEDWLPDWPGQVELRLFYGQSSAFASGVIQPVVMVPAYLVQLPPEQRQLLLRHELTHLQYRDPLVLLLWRLLLALCWFNPVLALWQKHWQQAVELRVDRQLCQDSKPELYAQTLLLCLKLNQQQQPNGLAFNRSSVLAQYQQRLTALFQPLPALPAPQQQSGSLLLLLFTLALTLGCAQLRFSQSPTEWLRPVAAEVRVSSFYGEQHPFRQNRRHQGMDFAAQAGDPVYASARGTVLIADNQSLNSNYGIAVLLDHGNGYQTLYAHLQQADVRPGQQLQAGQPLGKVGATGRVTGAHLHFELLQQGQAQDPALLLTTSP
ncbi:peptidoglycan DD-metalloendopeptidase family protein [Rheinheimera sp.]|uniref:peptidoglycan DD-metalloendopeptidase family protein n=1 Tax=Rheinheimera sp. TaxID=1869214 RepID=UPI00307ED795